MMQEAVKALAALSGKDVLVMAPSSSAVQVLKEQGFVALDTFQKLMESSLLQDVARGRIIWIDEAGFLSTRQMRWAVEFAARNDCRLILSGDTRQHHGVERGDALRVLERAGAVAQAALTKIFRQQIAALRDAVYDLRKCHEISVSHISGIRTNCIVPFSVERVGTNIYLCDLLF